MEEQLEQAVDIASKGVGDPSLLQQAFEYCNQVKSSDDGWQVCLAIFTGSSAKRSDASRFFSLQVLDSALPRLRPDQVELVRDNLFPYFQRSVKDSYQNSTLGQGYLRNKLAQTLAYLFILTYGESWPSFFDDFFALMSNDSSSVGNALAVDMYLRALRVIHEEIGDNLIVRDPEQTKRNNYIKDLVRSRDVEKLSSSWMTILDHYGNLSSDSTPLTNEILDGVLRVIGGWVSWIDITLIINSQYLTLIFNRLATPGQCLAACDCLVEIICKKMNPGDKLELIALLDLTTILKQFPASSSDIEFDERIAKLSNVVGSELISILDGNCPAQQTQRCESLLNDLWPTIFGFLSHEYDDVSVQVLSALGDYLVFLRKESKKEKQKVDKSKYQQDPRGQYIDFPDDSNFITAERRSILAAILSKTIAKMKYDPNEEWGGDDDDEDSEFLELRGKLKSLQEQIASIDLGLYIDGILSVVQEILDANIKSLSWQDVELALTEFSVYGEILKSKSVTANKGAESRAGQVIQELFFKLIASDIIHLNHPTVQLLYMELVVKYASMFTATQPGLLERVLEFFVSPLGVHNSDPRVQVRAWYLFLRFLKLVKAFVRDIGETVFNSISSLLVIRAEVPKDDGSEIDATQGRFESQLHLFEVCGILFTNDSDQQKGLELTQKLLAPIYSDLERSLQHSSSNKEELEQVRLQIHHNIMAIGTFARGFDEYAGGAGGGSGGDKNNKLASQEFKNAAQCIVVVVERLSDIEIIRASARFTFSRIIPILRSEVLPEITSLLNVLLSQCQVKDLAEFLSFLGQLVHSYQDSGIFNMFTSLIIPLMSRIFSLLNEAQNAASGGSTDAILLKKELHKSYLQFLFNILNNEFGAIFVVEQNQQVFETMLQSVFQLASEDEDAQTKKAALLVLSKMLATWGKGFVESNFGNGLKVPGFDDRFIFEHYTRACWATIGKPGFNPKDAQTRLVLSDAGALQKTIYDLKGDAYAEYLATNHLPSLGFPNDMAEEFINNLRASDAKNFKKFFVVFIDRLT